MERAGLLVLAERPSSHSSNGTAFSVLFITITATWPSGLRNAVARSASSVDVQATRRAPGRMNLDRWPMYQYELR